VHTAVRVRLFILAAAACLGSTGNAHAQFTPPPQTPASAGNIHVSSPSAVLDLGTRFLRHLGTEAAWQSVGPPRTFNPSGGGADLEAPPTAAQTSDRYRIWFEAYGQRTRMDPRGDFAGDKRRIVGGVAGLGMQLAPGISVGVSVDQSRTDIDIAPLAQSARIDLTQLGGNVAFESGPWTLGIAGIHGFGDVDSQRGTGAPSVTSYDTRLWGALVELSYYWSSGPWRVVPKIGTDWARAKSDAFVETGGTQPVAGSGQIAERARIFGGAEVGYTWLVNDTMMDVSVYGRGVDMVARHPGGLTIAPVTPGPQPRFLAGVTEDRLGVDAGAAFTVRLSSSTRLYAVYDARFRGNFESHAGTLGLEMRW
jgi:uncharacterized protein with beta-barrel porin domain